MSYPLSALDAAFIYHETDQATQATVNVYFVDTASAADGPMSRPELRRWIGDRVAQAPILTHRLRRRLLEIDSPAWVLAADFDLDEHVFVAEVGEHGWDPLRGRLAGIAARRLDLRKAPWEVHLLHGICGVDGLPDGASALAVKIHHSACDGIGSTDVARVLLGGRVEGDPLAMPRVGTARGSLWNALASIQHQWRDYADAKKRLTELRVDAQAAVEAGEVVAPQQTRPRTRFNGELSPGRGIAVVTFDMAEVRDVRTTVGDVTVNDVMLAVVAGALREYLIQEGELPEDSLAAMVPKSMRGLCSSDSANNFTPMIVDLHTDVEDPVLRLKTINDSVRSEKTRKEFPPFIESIGCAAATPAYVARGAACLERRSRPAATTVQLSNTTVSNYMREAPGLALADAPVVAISCLPLLDPGMTLSHMVASIGEKLTLTVSADMVTVPDLDRYAELLVDSFAALGGFAGSLK
ncbi:wax ester/triacylglycerol synthase domain-containing protein [Speluncibacter jeojiensis]|uniref:diacylglycerol O-acyltransferase n=1 Tax=Speluncibacter jeojiensis TaxID=2710754 RepID=A0A9X4M586_9ACTN|nr:WS/DGAT domain-containing protein [Corynebacteriales bacterium D3-21]